MNKNKSQTAIIGKVKNEYGIFHNVYSITWLTVNLVIVHIIVVIDMDVEWIKLLIYTIRF